MSTFKFYGIDATEEPGWMPGALGVVVGGQRLLNETYAVGQRLAEAGADGISVRTADRSQIENLRYAGHTIELDEMGLKYIMKGELRAPEQYIMKAQPKAEIKVASLITGGDWRGRGGR